MSAGKTHPDEVRIDAALVRRLFAGQFPQWGSLPVEPVELDGWDNRTFRLGEQLSMRLPSAAAYASQVQKEHRWLPRLAPHLPLPIPAPVAMGAPSHGYPWHWSVYRWIDGAPATSERIADLRQFATALGRFLVALGHVDPTDGPRPGPHNFHRGGPLATYDRQTRAAIADLHGRIDTEAATAAWEAALAASWHGPPVWFHGDVSYGNLLVVDGRLRAVIDFGTSGVGDPACDMAIAWTLFEGGSRLAFRAAVAADDAMWARGRGWTLWKALIVLAGHARTNDAVQTSRRVIHEVLADHARSRTDV